MNIQDKWESAKVSFDNKKHVNADDLRNSLAIAAVFKSFNYLGQGFTVLDLGCGNGTINGKRHEHYGYHYIDPVHTVYGCDVIAYPDYPGEKFVLGNAEALPFEGSFFDAVCISCALDHMLNPAKVFEESRRVLKSGGKLFVCQSVLHEYPALLVSKHHHHIYDYSLSVIVQLYIYAGFMIGKIKVAGHLIWMFEGIKL